MYSVISRTSCRLTFLSIALLTTACGGGGDNGTPPAGGNETAPVTIQMGGSIQGAELNLSNNVSTLVGQVLSSGNTNGTGTNAQFNRPVGITSDGENLYIADSFNHEIRKIVIATGEVTKLTGNGISPGFNINGVPGAATFNNPFGITTDGTSLYVVEGGGQTIRKIDIATRFTSAIAGRYGTQGSADGFGTDAHFNIPTSITTEGTNLFITDYLNNTIRKIVISTGEVSTFAGTAGTTGSNDGTGSAAGFNNPTGITTDGTNLYVTEFGNHAIRKIVIATGVVTTFAGSTAFSGSTDGTGANARFNSPFGITCDGTNLYVTETGNHTIRKVVIATGEVTTIAGSALSIDSTDGAGNLARFNTPKGITTDGTHLFVSDSENFTVRQIK